MPYGAIFDVPAPIDTYDQLIPAVEEVTHGMPQGCLVHIATPTDAGYRVIEVWESEDHWRRFRTEILTPIVQRATGEESPSQPTPQPFPVHSVRTAGTT
jgi:hypothetical protein